MLLLGVIATLAVGQPRIHELLDAGWRFSLDRNHPVQRGLDTTWKWRPLPDDWAADAKDISSVNPDSASDAKTAAPGEDIFHGRRGFSIMSTTLNVPAGVTVLHFASVDDNATVYLGGKYMLHHEGYNEPFDVPLAGYGAGETLPVEVVVENTDGPGSVGSIWFAKNDTDALPEEAKPAFDDSGWRTVHLPHDYVIEGTFNEADDAGHGALARTQAWYRRTFEIPDSPRHRSIWIDFEGAYADAHVWLNGHFLGSHRSGYTGFRFELPEMYLQPKNVLAVHLDASKTEGWWYEGGGLYRHVWLTVAAPVHVAPVGGVFVTTTVPDPLSSRPVAAIHFETKVDGSMNELPVQVRSTVIRPGGSVVGTSIKAVYPGHTATLVSSEINEPEAKLWSIEHPTLYSLVTDLLVGGQVVDTVTTPFGIRTIRFDANEGFFLNGRPVKLKGTCNHQDFMGVGIAMPDSILEWRIKKLKELGSNAYRCSHNEVAPELLDACDRLGMVVMDENREYGDTRSGKANERTTTKDVSDLTEEVLQDRNHPSVIMWSLGNEEFAIQTTPAGGRIATALGAVVRKLDPTRPFTAALNGGHGHSMSAALDLEGFNYNPGEYTSYHLKHPKALMFGSETASTTTDRGEYVADKVHGYVPGYDTQGLNTTEDAWQPIAERPYMAGAFVWTGFDYKGEPTPYGWPCVNSHFGIIDMCGFWKDIAYYYQAWWGDKPAVHVFPTWNWAGKEGQPIKVWAYGNGDAVELFLNGESLGRKSMPKYRHVEWSVPYHPGVLVAKCYSGDRLIATDRVETTGEPVSLRLEPSKKRLKADSEDCSMLTVSVLDAKGRVVPNADNLVTFTTRGVANVVGVGNGDPSSHEPDRASQRHAWHGLCMGILQANEQAGGVTVTVSSPGLRSATARIQVR